MTITHHVGICPADIETSLRFYRDGIGLAVVMDVELPLDLGPLLAVSTETVRTVFLGDPQTPDAGVIELLDVRSQQISDAAPAPGTASRGAFLVSFQVEVEEVLARLEDLGLAGTVRSMESPLGGRAITVTDPDGVMVELLPAGRPVLGG